MSFERCRSIIISIVVFTMSRFETRHFCGDGPDRPSFRIVLHSDAQEPAWQVKDLVKLCWLPKGAESKTITADKAREFHETQWQDEHKLLFPHLDGARPCCGCRERFISGKVRYQRGDYTQATDEITAPTSLVFGMLSWAASSKRLSFPFFVQGPGAGGLQQ